MKGQAKALIPALIGIAILLLTGISGVFLPSGEQQATTDTNQTVGREKVRHEESGAAFRSDADAAALQTYMEVAADMEIELQRPPKYVIAMADQE